jgi:AcrR family transcriptional regulator
MARNKREIDKDAKRADIVGAARSLFLEKGYDDTSMSALAAAVGVAPNTLYWYFANKDELLVAVLNTTLATVYQDFLSRQFTSFDAHVFWLYEQLLACNSLVITVHARVPVSEPVAEWHTRFHQMVGAMFTWLFSQTGAAPAHINSWLDICTLTLEGLLSHQFEPARARQALTLLLAAMQPAEQVPA